MEALVQYLAGEGRVILQAPTIFAVAIILVAAVIWSALRWSYASRIEVLEGRLKLRDDQIADYKQKLSGATPEEARNRIDALELQVAALAPRRLSVDQRQRILGVIRECRFLIHIIRDMGANEARKLALDVEETFNRAGWTTQAFNAMGIGNHPVSGNAIRVLDPSNLRPAELAVKRALVRFPCVLNR